VADTLREAVHAGRDHEAAVFALASHTQVGQKALMLVRKVLPLAEEAYVSTHNHGAKWLGGAMVPLINEALRESFGIMIFHTHDHSGAIGLSNDDRQSAYEMLAVFQNLIPFRPHGSVVFGKDHAAGVVILPDQTAHIENVNLRWIGKTITDFGSGKTHLRGDIEEPKYHRQKLLIGDRGQSNLRQARIAVVGLSGGGSHVVQQLAHIGVGQIIGVDFDRAEATNRSRLIGIGWFDDVFRTMKTDIMARMVRRINRDVRFTKVSYPIPDQRAIDALYWPADPIERCGCKHRR